MDYGNKLNEEATGTTVLQVWRSTSMVEQAWKKNRQEMHWPAASVGQKALADKKLELALSMYPGRWTTYTSYERCNIFFKVANKLTLETGPDTDKTVWQVVHSRFKASVAASQMAGSSFDAVLHQADDIMRVLKGQHPEYIADVLLLCLPGTEGP